MRSAEVAITWFMCQVRGIGEDIHIRWDTTWKTVIRMASKASTIPSARRVLMSHLALSAASQPWRVHLRPRPWQPNHHNDRKERRRGSLSYGLQKLLQHNRIRWQEWLAGPITLAWMAALDHRGAWMDKANPTEKENRLLRRLMLRGHERLLQKLWQPFFYSYWNGLDSHVSAQKCSVSRTKLTIGWIF